MIEVKNLTKKYGSTAALSKVSLTIADGSIFGLIGVNGAGKSTLLRTLSGVFAADEGFVFVDDEIIFENPKKKKEILFLPDDPYYSLGTTCNDLANLYKTFYSFDTYTFEYYINLFGLKKDMPMRSFSKGMKRQVFVALAFACNPRYLLLDETFDGLDPASRLVLKRGIIELASNGGTVVISSHSLRELEDICDSFAIIDNKNIATSGSIRDSLERIYKFHVAFSHPVNPAQLGFDCLSTSAGGRILKIVVSGDKDFYLDRLAALNPLIIEEQPIDLEEFFVIKTQKNLM